MSINENEFSKIQNCKNFEDFKKFVEIKANDNKEESKSQDNKTESKEDDNKEESKEENPKRFIPFSMKNGIITKNIFSDNELLIWCESENKEEGHLNYFDCQKCLNRGYISYIDSVNRLVFRKECECMRIRKGIEKQLDYFYKYPILRECSLNNFITNYNFQKQMKLKAIEFLKVYKNSWFFVGGQYGSGKSYICYAIVNELIKDLNDFVLFEYIEDLREIKSHSTDLIYLELIEKYKKATVLYFDDFLKVDLNIADLKIIYEIINYRYKENKVTLFSSEKLFSELANIDEAIESRIFEKANNFILDIDRDRQKNFRYKKSNIIRL